MALGAITQIPVNPSGAGAQTVLGPFRVTISNVVLDSSYPTGGSPLTPAQLGFGPQGVVLFSITSIAAGGATGDISDGYYNAATQKLQAFTATGEVAAATNLSSNTVQIVAFGY